LFILAACNFLGMGFTFLAPESNGISLEELSGENDEETAAAPPAHARTVPV
jgi:PHS family inorganic phosphate transporter-like MFS transporter